MSSMFSYRSLLIAALGFLTQGAFADALPKQTLEFGETRQSLNGYEEEIYSAGAVMSGDFAIVPQITLWDYGLPPMMNVYQRLSDGSWKEQGALETSDAPMDGYGEAGIALSGDTAMIGAHGMVYVFTRDTAGIWIEHSRLKPSGEQQNTSFGSEIAIADGTALIADGDHVYMFARNGSGQWSREGTVYPAPGGSIDNLAIAGDVALIASRSQYKTNKVDIFERHEDGYWRYQQTLLNKLGGALIPQPANPLFGFKYDVAISGDTLFVGVPHELGPEIPDDTVDKEESSRIRGALYVFRRSPNGNWLQEDRLTPTDSWRYSGFGRSLSVDGDLLLVGSSIFWEYTANSDLDYAAARLFQRQASGKWLQIKTLENFPHIVDGPSTGWQQEDDFANDVSLSGTDAYVSDGWIYDVSSVLGPVLSLTDYPYVSVDFEPVSLDAPAAETLTVFNRGTVELAITAVAVDYPFTVDASVCAVIPPLSECPLTLTIDSSQSGDFSGEVTVSSNDPRGDQSIPVTATVLEKDVDDTGSIPTNLALNRKGFASTVADVQCDASECVSYAAASALDGDSSTLWHSRWSKNEWLAVQLDRESEVSQVVIKWGKDYAREYGIYASNDGKNWRQLQAVLNFGAGNNDDPDVTSFDQDTVRFIGVLGVKSATGNGFGIREFEVYP